MPTRGYRKGISDRKEPVPCSVRTHISAREFTALNIEAEARAMTLSKLLRTCVTAHLTGTRAELPHRRGPSHAALRELTRIGNNLNQLARQANTGLVTIPEQELRACLEHVLAAARRL